MSPRCVTSQIGEILFPQLYLTSWEFFFENLLPPVSSLPCVSLDELYFVKDSVLYNWMDHQTDPDQKNIMYDYVWYKMRSKWEFSCGKVYDHYTSNLTHVTGLSLSMYMWARDSLIWSGAGIGLYQIQVI